MHPAQRRAIVAIISMIEQGLGQLKGLLFADDAGQHISHPQAELPSDGPLTDADEMGLEELMEQHRKSMEADATQIAERAYRGDPLGFFNGDQ